MSASEDLAKTLLALPVQQRVQLAESLLASLPVEGELYAETEELSEEDRRAEQMETGQVQPLTDGQFWEQVEAARRRWRITP